MCHTHPWKQEQKRHTHTHKYTHTHTRTHTNTHTRMHIFWDCNYEPKKYYEGSGYLDKMNSKVYVSIGIPTIVLTNFYS